MKKAYLTMGLIIIVTFLCISCGTDITGNDFKQAVEDGNISESGGDLLFNVEADTGPDMITSPETSLQLSGSKSSGISGEFNINWTVITSPTGSEYSFNNSKIIDPVFTADTIGDYEVKLSLKNDISESADTIIISIENALINNSDGVMFKLLPSVVNTSIQTSYQDGISYTTPLVSYGIYLMTTEVTQAQWVSIMGTNPSVYQSGSTDYPCETYTCSDCSDCPVENIPREEINEFIIELNKKGEGTYRLPTASEWVYAAKAGSFTDFANGDITDETADYCGADKIDPVLGLIGWYCSNTIVELVQTGFSETQEFNIPQPVATKEANAWGFYDMHGNIAEMVVNDYYYTEKELTTNSEELLPSEIETRGGHVGSRASACTPEYTHGSYSYDSIPSYTGLRLVLIP